MAQTLQWLILAGRAARSFAVGAFVVVVPLAINEDGLGTVELNTLLAAGLAGASVQMQIVHWLSSRIGRVACLALYTAAMLIAGSTFLVTRDAKTLIAMSFIGAFSLQPNISVHAPLEQASLADVATGSDRTKVFAWYNGISTISIAAGSAGMAIPISGGTHSQVAIICCVLFATVAAYLALQAIAYHSADGTKEVLLDSVDLPLKKCRHFWRILGLAALFGVDSFAGGMTMNSFLVHWMVRQFDMGESTLGTLFAVSGVITTPSLWVAAWLGNKIGLVNTMVFTHLPSNVGLIILPFMPNTACVILVTLFRAMLSQMDVPARDSFMMTVVDKDERVACSSFITSVRGLACVAGPPVAALLWKQFDAGTPLIMAGCLKCAYDLSLLFTFRAVHGARPNLPS